MPLLGMLSRAFGFLFNIIGSELYSFTTFTFTNANITGRTGPTLANCLSAYDTTTYSWLNSTDNFNVSPQGIQLWTVPKSGTYEIEAVGAQGYSPNNDSYGAKCIGRFSLTKSDKLKIAVGQRGSSGSSGCGGALGGGGGGSFVTTTANTPLIIAAGGGGKSALFVTSSVQANANATFINSETYGNTGQDTGGTGGTGGNGGNYKSGQCVNNSGAGGGLNTDGGQAPGHSTGGKAFINGAVGGLGFADYGGSPAAGGFGGGGASNTYMGGGGGGYNGGGCGGVQSCSCANLGGGGGGGCYNSGTNQTNTVLVSASQFHGYVKITFIS